MAVVLGLLVAVVYGSGDFLGGLASKRTTTASVVIGSFVTSVTVLLLAAGVWAMVAPLPALSGRNVALGVGAGFVGPVALSALYWSLAHGRMSVVAPTTAVVAAVVPFGFGLATGERPAALAIVGASVALIAVVLISGAPTHGDEDLVGEHVRGPIQRRLAATSLLAGVGFGITYVLLGSVRDDPGLWPLLAARSTSLLLVPVAILAWGWVRPNGVSTRQALTPASGAAALIVGTGVLDITANALYLAAAQRGLLSIVAILASLYPASTVVLARMVIAERLHRIQLFGLALAAAGVLAMALA